MKLIESEELWDRDLVKSHTENLYIFGDNTNRNSGKRLINPNRFYTKKYGKNCHFPTVTSACIRGLDNALPICTQRWYNSTHKGINGRWQDQDIDIFKKVIDDEINEIKIYCLRYRPENVILPPGGLFNSPISAINKDRVPEIYTYLKSKLEELSNYINKL